MKSRTRQRLGHVLLIPAFAFFSSHCGGLTAAAAERISTIGQAALNDAAAANDASTEETAGSDKTPGLQTEEEKRKAAESTVRLFGKIFGSILDDTGEDAAEEDELLQLIGQPAPKFELESITGEKIRLEDLRGRVVVLDFWATWCGPCVAALPEIEQVHTHFANQDVTVIGVNQQEELDAVKAFLAQHGTTFTQLLDADSNVSDSFGVSSIPQTVLIDKAGIIQDIHTGFAPDLRQKMIANIERLLKGEKLYDEQKVAEARRKLDEQRTKLIDQIGLHQPERLERLDEVLTEKDATISSAYNPPQWITLPGQAEPALAIVSSQHRIAVIRPGQPAETIDVDWSEEVGIWDFAPVLVGGKLHWAVLGAEYDDEYDVKQFTIALIDDGGKTLWTQIFPALDIDSYPSVDMVAADLTGDGDSEIAIMVKHDGLEDGVITGPDGAARVLTLHDAKGEKLLRAWVPGAGDASLIVYPDTGGTQLLIATTEGITRFRIKP